MTIPLPVEHRHVGIFAGGDRQTLELREAEGEPSRLVGYAAVFNSLSGNLGGFREKLLPGAFSASLANAELDVRALVDHDYKRIMGRRSAGTLRLSEDDVGLRIANDPPDTSYARDLLASIRRGDIRGMSFGFYVDDDGERWTRDGDDVVRVLTRVELVEVTFTSIPAYPAASVDLRQHPALARVPDEVRGRVPSPRHRRIERARRMLTIAG